MGLRDLVVLGIRLLAIIFAGLAFLSIGNGTLRGMLYKPIQVITLDFFLGLLSISLFMFIPTLIFWGLAKPLSRLATKDLPPVPEGTLSKAPHLFSLGITLLGLLILTSAIPALFIDAGSALLGKAGHSTAPPLVQMAGDGISTIFGLWLFLNPKSVFRLAERAREKDPGNIP